MEETNTTTYEAILASACDEFLEKGYQNAGLRDIAKKAGVTTGALYGYFSNKTELFEALVKKQYDRLMQMYKDTLCAFAALPPAEQLTRMPSYTAKAVERMTDYLYANKTAFRLILCCSGGTAYSHLIRDMAELDLSATHAFAEVSGEAGTPVSPVNPMLEHMLTNGMFSAYFELIIHDIPRTEADEYISQLLAFYYAGWSEIMGM